MLKIHFLFLSLFLIGLGKPGRAEPSESPPLHDSSRFDEEAGVSEWKAAWQQPLPSDSRHQAFEIGLEHAATDRLNLGLSANWLREENENASELPDEYEGFAILQLWRNPIGQAIAGGVKTISRPDADGIDSHEFELLCEAFLPIGPYGAEISGAKSPGKAIETAIELFRSWEESSASVQWTQNGHDQPQISVSYTQEWMEDFEVTAELQSSDESFSQEFATLSLELIFEMDPHGQD